MEREYLQQSGYIEDTDSSGWRFGYWYSTNLIQCPDCKKLISPSAVSCPGCGRPMSASTSEGESEKTKCPHCGKMVRPIVTNVGGGSCSVGSREKWSCPSCKGVIQRTGCFVATATYGNDDAIEVRFLRAYRDQYMKKSTMGNTMIWLYYHVAPYPAWIVGKIEPLRRIARIFLDRIVRQIEKRTTLKRKDYING